MRQVELSRRRARLRCESSPARRRRLLTEIAWQWRSNNNDGCREPNYSNLHSLWLWSAGRPRPAGPFGSAQGRLTRRPSPHDLLPLVIKPELYRHFGSRIILRQRAEGIDALKCLGRRPVERRHAARLLDLNVRRVTVT